MTVKTYWRLRTAGNNSNNTYNVDSTGNVNNNYNVNNSDVGIRPDLPCGQIAYEGLYAQYIKAKELCSRPYFSD